MTRSVPSTLHPGLRRPVDDAVERWNRLGRQARFYAETVAGVGQAIGRYPAEVLRLVAEMSLGIGALALIGGAIVVIGALTMSVGSLLAIQFFPQLQQVGVDALAGFISALINTRYFGPIMVGIGVSATIGAGATAQLGAMRINEEIDALETMSIRAVPYLCSTRLVAGAVVVTPLFAVAMLLAYIATQFLTTSVYGQSSGVYDHYFYTFLNPTDLLWSFFLAEVVGILAMLVHTFYGYTASGGPAGVGEAVGRSVRTSMIVLCAVVLLVTIAIYGPSGNFHFSG
jgi:phospholipid/cholesterol/gamma-HCH transport system permease protein